MSGQATRAMAGQLAGRVALVTGAASGIGKSVATLLAQQGATTIFADLDGEALDDAVASMGTAQVEATRFDVADAAAWAATVDAIARTHGRLDILVNCAGIYLLAPTALTAFEDFSRVIDVNLSSVFFGLKFAAPLMAKSPEPMIVNIASTLGIRARELAGAYAASKAGVISLTRSAAQEFARQGAGIRVNAVCPGPTDTAILDILDAATLAELGGRDAIRERARQSVPLGRFAAPDEIGEAVLFLLSDRARFMTGSCLVIDGGQSA